MFFFYLPIFAFQYECFISNISVNYSLEQLFSHILQTTSDLKSIILIKYLLPVCRFNARHAPFQNAMVLQTNTFK
jgi:hypothetical protein